MLQKSTKESICVLSHTLSLNVLISVTIREMIICMFAFYWRIGLFICFISVLIVCCMGPELLGFNAISKKWQNSKNNNSKFWPEIVETDAKLIHLNDAFMIGTGTSMKKW